MINRSAFRAATRQIRASVRPSVTRRQASSSSATFDWEDPLAAKELYTEEELAIQDTARQYCQERLFPRVLGGLLLLMRCCLGGVWSTIRNPRDGWMDGWSDCDCDCD